jgi:hypothetical protein
MKSGAVVINALKMGVKLRERTMDVVEEAKSSKDEEVGFAGLVLNRSCRYSLLIRQRWLSRESENDRPTGVLYSTEAAKAKKKNPKVNTTNVFGFALLHRSTRTISWPRW